MNSIKNRDDVTLLNGQPNEPINKDKPEVVHDGSTKAKSVLQAKLSHLSIQIGYIGTGDQQ